MLMGSVTTVYVCAVRVRHVLVVTATSVSFVILFRDECGCVLSASWFVNLQQLHAAIRALERVLE